MTPHEDIRTIGNMPTIGDDISLWKLHDPGTVFLALAVVEKDPEGGYTSYTPSLPGAVSQGQTPEEAMENLREAIVGCIESYREAGKAVPWVHDPEEPADTVLCEWIGVHV
jgi:antitoxin HicB